MARVKIAAFILTVAMVLAIAVTDAQTICNMPASGLMACKPAVTPPNPPPPTSTCCSALSHADMRCLCSYKNSKLLPSLAGVRFSPKAKEIFDFYLRPAIHGEPMPYDVVVQREIYGENMEPWKIFDNKDAKEPSWVFTKLKKKDKRIDRTVG
ncbi:hypothetical protein DITRI_Ditri15bG0030200 [Diplodiscus trichospermus]